MIDSLLWVKEKIEQDALLCAELDSRYPFLDPLKRLILVTGHRRESFGDGFERICKAFRQIVAEHDNVQIVYPVHLNPKVREPVERLLQGVENIYLLAPQAVSTFCLFDDAFLFDSD